MNKTHALLADIHDDAVAWVNEQLCAKGLPPVEKLCVVREMAWSLVAKVEHAQGCWYFKCLPSYFAQELAVTEFLSQCEPTYVAQFIASDSQRGYLLVDDAGRMFRELTSSKEVSALWLDVLAQYAQLQITAMHHPITATLGLPNRSLEKLPALFGRNFAQVCQFNSDVESEQCRSEHVARIEQAFVEWPSLIAPLYQFGIRDTINHGDMHDGNLGFRAGAKMFDWGDASLTHPFMSLRSVIFNICRRFNIEPNGDALEPYIRAYLTPWTQFADYDELRAMVESAKKVWSSVAFLSWRHALQNQNDARAIHYNGALPAVLRTFAEDLRASL